MQKVYMIFEAMVIKVKNFCQAHLIVKVTSIQKIAIWDLILMQADQWPSLKK